MSRVRALVYLVVSLILVALSGYVIATTEPLKRSVFDGDIPASDTRVQSFNLAKDLLPNQEWVGVIVWSETTIFTSDNLRLVRNVTENFKHLPSMVLDSVTSLATTRVISSSIRNEALGSASLMTEEDLTHANGAEVVNERLMRHNLLRKKLVDRTSRATLVGGYLAPGYNQAEVAHKLDELAKRLTIPGVELLPVGNIVANQAIDDGIEAQANIYVVAALAILLGIFAVWRMFLAGLAMIGVLVIGFAELRALQLVLAIPDSVVSSAVQLLLVALGVSYFYYFARHAAIESVAAAYQKLAAPTWFSAIATAYGFGTLYTFQIMSIREFGLLTALGIGVVLFNSRTLYPALFTLWPQRLVPQQTATRPMALGATRWLLGLHRSSIVILLVLGFVLFAHAGREKLRTDTDPFRFFPAEHQVVRALKALDQFGGNTELIVAIRPKGSPMDPAFMEQLYRLEKALEELPRVGNVEGYAGLSSYVVRHYEGKPPAEDVERFTADVPGLVEQLVSQADIERVMSLDRSTVFVRVWASAWTSSNVQAVLVDIRSALQASNFASYHDVALDGNVIRPFVAVGGFDALWVAIGDYIVDGKMANFWWSVLLMPLVAFWFVGDGGQGLFGRLGRSIIVTIPLGVALYGVLGTMGWLGIQLDLATCVITSIGVGVGEDFAIHLLHFYDEHGSFEGAAAANAELLSYAFLTAAGFSVFALSDFLPLRLFAWLVILILALSYLAAIILVPYGVRRLGIRAGKVNQVA